MLAKLMEEVFGLWGFRKPYVIRTGRTARFPRSHICHAVCVAFRISLGRSFTETMKELGYSHSMLRPIFLLYLEHKKQPDPYVVKMVEYLRKKGHKPKEVVPTEHLTDGKFVHYLRHFAADVTGATYEELGMKVRYKHVVWARKMLYQVLRDYGWTSEEIAAEMPILSSTIRRYYTNSRYELMYEDFSNDVKRLTNYAKTLDYEERY